MEALWTYFAFRHAGMSAGKHSWEREISQEEFDRNRSSDISDSEEYSEDEYTSSDYSEDDDQGPSARQMRIEQAQQCKRSDSARLHPRTLAEIQQAVLDGTILQPGSLHQGLDEIRMQIKEHAEFRATPWKWKHQNADRMEAVCDRKFKDDNGDIATCGYHVLATFQLSEGKMIVDKFSEHQCLCSAIEQHAEASAPNPGSEPHPGPAAQQETQQTKENANKKKATRKSTWYIPRELAHTPEMKCAFKEKANLSNNDIRSIARPYTRRHVSDHQCADIRNIARELICGKEEAQLSKLPGTVRFLQQQGHAVESIPARKERMIQAFMDREKGRYERQQKKLSAAQQKPWNEHSPSVRAGLDKRFSRHPANAVYVYALSIGFKAAILMLSLQVLFPIVFADAAHNKGASGGTTTYSTWALDADHGLILLASTYCIGAECLQGWKIHAEFFKHKVLQKNFHSSWTVIIDGIVSGINAFESLGFYTFMCSRHLAKNLSAEQSKLYFKALHAKTMARLKEIKLRDEALFASLEAKHLPRQLYQLMSGRVCGHHVQSPAESGNNLSAKLRFAFHVLGKVQHMQAQRILFLPTYK